MKIKDFMQVIDYRITDCGEFLWNCYGTNVRAIDYWNGLHEHGGHSTGIIFDTVDQTVYEMSTYDYQRNRAYRWINPGYREAYNIECISRDFDDIAWDNVKYTELDLEEDILEKTSAIVNGLEYDTRIMIQLEFNDDELLEYMKMAHEQDITFNQLVERALRHVIDNSQN